MWGLTSPVTFRLIAVIHRAIDVYDHCRFNWQTATRTCRLSFSSSDFIFWGITLQFMLFEWHRGELGDTTNYGQVHCVSAFHCFVMSRVCLGFSVASLKKKWNTTFYNDYKESRQRKIGVEWWQCCAFICFLDVIIMRHVLISWKLHSCYSTESTSILHAFNSGLAMAKEIKLVFAILLSIFALTPAPIPAHSRSLPLTPAHSRSLPHVLMHDYLWENDKRH